MKSLFAILAAVLILTLTILPQSFGQNAPAASITPTVITAPMATPVAVPVTSVAPVAPPAFVTSIIKAVGSIPSSIPTWILAVLAFLVELCMRFFPTVKPVSVFLVVSSLCAALATGFQKISNLLDLVIQNIKTGSTT